jgi:hypothetical protein
MKMIDMTGKTIGRWSVLERDYGAKRVSWLCVCECGVKRSVPGITLRGGKSLSCGCLIVDTNTTHGYGIKWDRKPEYTAWGHMKARCFNERNKSYKNYGGRGITVCDEWKNDFSRFLEDMRNRPNEEFTLERIDNDGDYTPENCIWASRKSQSRNRRVTKVWVVHGKEYETYRDAAKDLGLNRQVVFERFNNMPGYYSYPKYQRSVIGEKR